MNTRTKFFVVYVILILLGLIVFPLMYAHGLERGRKDRIAECLDQQVREYGDLCAESSSGYEEMTGSDAHFDGVACAVESAKICIGVE